MCSGIAGSQSIVLAEEVRLALSQGRPVVALESTIITHGMVYPQNLETAKAVEELVRSHSVVPATIAILEGVPTVGLTPAQLKQLAAKGRDVRKCSIRDLPYVTANALDGSTTVAATMHVAHLAGIHVFVTGGIGGVHRGGHHTLDISADLVTAGRVPIMVVCAGAKSILDIPRTLEVLETQGVCVAAYQTQEFPAFFTPKSDCNAPFRIDTPEEAARLIDAARAMQTNSGIVLGVPIAEEDAPKGEEIEAAIQVALKECDDAAIEGPDVTPFLLRRLAELTGGASLESNICLIKNNAKVGCQIARALSDLRRKV